MNMERIHCSRFPLILGSPAERPAQVKVVVLEGEHCSEKVFPLRVPFFFFFFLLWCIIASAGEHTAMPAGSWHTLEREREICQNNPRERLSGICTTVIMERESPRVSPPAPLRGAVCVCVCVCGLMNHIFCLSVGAAQGGGCPGRGGFHGFQPPKTP
eukprot:TRINITY_DN12550_c1_g1_i1.p1 TRINITY_DN12550_c1_g1~~TRINITY_DN12550_c1_g1_i1.p1  ORF type:complete len:157 (-),score=0.52 TRINITY_DN12550_c1_g1_i1:77-547(-)